MASLLLSNGKYLHTAYAVSNIAEEFTNDDWSLSSQEGFGYIGQYIDDSAVDSSDPTDYVWTEFLDEDVDDLDDEGDMPMADFQSQIDALQDQIEVLQGDAENLQSSIEVNASNVADSAQLASEAADIANATGQYFWHDANGAHVSTEENNPEGERNSIWNSLGMLFRKGATNLLAILAGGASGTDPKGIAIYDGQGNSESNIMARFTQKVMQYLRNGVELFSLETSFENENITEKFGFNYTLGTNSSTTKTQTLMYSVSEFTECYVELHFGNLVANAVVNIGETHTFSGAGGGATLTPTLTGNVLTFAITTGSVASDGLEVEATYKSTDDTVSKVYLGAYPEKTPSNVITVGNGTSDNDRSNAFEVDLNGGAKFGGGVASQSDTRKFGSTFRVTEVIEDFETTSNAYSMKTHQHQLNGYSPICVQGYRFDGTHATLQNVYRVQLVHTNIYTCEVNISSRDTASSGSGTCTLYTWVLWAKEAQQ